jgi:hypothetical protein
VRIMAAHMSTSRSKQFQHLGHGWCQRFAVGCTSLAASTALHRPSERATGTVSGTCSLRCLAARRQPSAATVSRRLRRSLTGCDCRLSLAPVVPNAPCAASCCGSRWLGAQRPIALGPVGCLASQCHGEGSEHAVSLKDHRPVVSSHGSLQHMKRVHRTYGGSAAPRPLFQRQHWPARP